MFPKKFQLLVLVLLLASGGLGYWLGHVAGIPDPAYAADTSPTIALPEKISTETPIEEILMLMLHSHERWQSAVAQGVIRDSAGHEIYHHLVVLQESLQGPFFVRVEFGLSGQNMPFLYVMDGEKLWQAHTGLKIYTERPYHDDSIYPPEKLPAVNSPNNPIISHPLERLLPSPLIELLFPAGIAQSMYLDVNNVSILKEDEVVGRQAIVLQWLSHPLKYLFYIDTRTGSVLRREVYSTYLNEGAFAETWYEQIELTKIAFNEEKSLSLFQFQPGNDFRFFQPLDFEQVTSDDWMKRLDEQIVEKGE